MRRAGPQPRKVLELGLFRGPAIRAPAATLMLLVPRDERPLRGDAGRVDWRLCGRISELLLSEFTRGDFGEATLLPAGPLLPAERILLFGVGDARALQSHGVWRCLRAAVPRLLAIGTRDLSIAFPESIDLARHASSALGGLLEGISAEHGSLRMRAVLPNADQHTAALRHATKEVARAASRSGVLLEVEWIRDPADPGVSAEGPFA